MDILRIEHIETCAGPYQSIITWKVRDHDIEAGCPCPNEDKELSEFLTDNEQNLKHYIFGFETKNAFLSWFSSYDELLILYSEKYVLKIIKNVNTYFSSKFQTIFISDDTYDTEVYETFDSFLNFITEP